MTHRTLRRRLDSVHARLTLLAAAFVVALLCTPAAGQKASTVYVPDGWEGAYEFGYAPVIRVGDQVIVSGIPAGGDGSYQDKVRRMYQRAKELLEVAGASIEDVVELTTFHVQPKDSAAFGEEFELYMPIHREFFGDHRPAWSAVGTTVLLSPSAVVEMRLVAFAGSGAGHKVIRGAARSEN